MALKSKICFGLLWVLLCMAVIPGFAQQAKLGPVISKSKDFQRRNGLPNVFWKIKHQRQIKVAYIGGSITAAQDGWRDVTFHWFRIKYPENAFYQSNYAVGGTGSVLGVFRLDALLAEKPDLLFVEFAVNDENDMSVNRRMQSMEGIVRKTWKTLPNTDICFVYTTAKRFCDTMSMLDKRIPTVLDHEKVAQHYGIPSIDMGLDVVRAAADGRLVLSAAPAENANHIVMWGTGDDYHPLSESGHAFYAGVVNRCLKKMSGSGNGAAHKLPAALMPDNWQESRMLQPADMQLSGDWKRLTDAEAAQIGGAMPNLYKAGPGAAMKFKFTGTELGIYDIIGPGSGMIAVTIDGKTQQVKRFDHNCWFWHKHNIFLDKLPEGQHTAEIKVTGEAFDKKSVMKPGDEPEKYAGYNWYPSAVLVTGRLLK